MIDQSTASVSGARGVGRLHLRRDSLIAFLQRGKFRLDRLDQGHGVDAPRAFLLLLNTTPFFAQNKTE